MSKPQTYLDVLDSLAGAGDAAGFTFVEADGSERTVGWASLVAEARSRATKLRSLGLQKGDRVALIIPGAYDFVLTFLGAVAGGIVPVPLYPPLALARLDAYLDTTARILQVAAADLIVTSGSMEKILWSLVPRAPTVRDLVTVEKIASRPNSDELGYTRPEVAPEDPVFLQFTSGSTAAPKGVVVTHSSLVANASGIILDGLRADPAVDKGVSWLPLYHDMGLIGFVLAPLIRCIPVVFIPTMAFVKRPGLWMDVVHKHRATLTFGPNFAFARLAKRATEAELAKWDLSCLRVVGCGAEPIQPGTMRAFVDKLAPTGLKPEALLPCYGMAEATLAISFVGLTETMATDHHGGLELVSIGKPFPGHEVAIFEVGDERDQQVADHVVGEIRYRGPSVAGGYFRNPEATRAAFGADGWLRTGDLGYLLDGNLYISGRQKDLLIINGRNYHPQAVEWAVEEVAGIRKGNVVAFSVPGADTEELVVVAETGELDPEKRRALAQQVKSQLSKATQLSPRDVVLVGVGELPKTTSGKLQRRKTREQYLARTLGREGVRTVGATGERLLLVRHFMVSLASRVTHKATTLWPWWPMSMVVRRRQERARAEEGTNGLQSGTGRRLL